MTSKFVTNSVSETRALGEKFGSAIKNLDSGIVILMFGDLGTGKTVFVKGVGESLGVSGVRSPSFTLVNEYECENHKFLIHADLYRLENFSQISSLGLEEYENDFLFIEWSERLQSFAERFGENVVRICFESLSENQRVIEIICENSRLCEKLS